MPSDLEKHPEIVEAIKKMRGEMNLGYRTISTELEKRFNYKTSHQTIKNFIDSGGMLEQTKDTVEARDVLNVLKQLEKVNKKMWEIFKTVDKDVDKYGYARANILNKILQQLEFMSKLLGKLSSTKITANISYLNFSVKVTKYLTVLEKEGFIKIIKRPLKAYQE